jgi:hypothetical protein
LLVPVVVPVIVLEAWLAWSWMGQKYITHARIVSIKRFRIS